jgi:hypothetical protein
MRWNFCFQNYASLDRTLRYLFSGSDRMKTRQFFFEGSLQLHAGDTELFDLMHLISFAVPCKEIIRSFNLQYCSTQILLHCWCVICSYDEYSRFLLGYSDYRLAIQGDWRRTKRITLWATLKIACSVRRCRSVKTNRGFLGAGVCSGWFWGSSFLLQAVK